MENVNRRFKPGDIVEYKDEGIRMTVIKYVTEEDVFGETDESTTYVECEWFDKDKTVQRGVFHQGRLMKITNI